MRKNNIPGEMPKVYIIHENEAWITTLLSDLNKIGVSHEQWFLNDGQLELNSTPPKGIFYNRMSASSHTRGHRYAVEYTATIIAWLESHNRRIINNRRALQLEVSKVEQYLSLKQFGLQTPKTISAVGKEQTIKAAKSFEGQPFILKPNRGGKGLGVQLFNSINDLGDYLNHIPLKELTLDGVLLIQEYILPKDETITRMEFIGGVFYYAVSVDTGGGFELCPANECEIETKNTHELPQPIAENPKFKILEGFKIPEISKCETFLAENNIEIAGIEFVENQNGERFFYDVNTNTNYNDTAEKKSKLGYNGMERIAEFLSKELRKVMQNELSPFVMLKSV